MVSNDLLHPSSNTTFQNFPGISDLLSEVSNFQDHKMYAPDVALRKFTELITKHSTLEEGFGFGLQMWDFLEKYKS
jgi:hypothetical protein